MRTPLRLFSISTIFVALVFAAPAIMAQRQRSGGSGQRPAPPPSTPRGDSGRQGVASPQSRGGGRPSAMPAPTQGRSSGISQGSGPATVQRGDRQRPTPPSNQVGNDGDRRRQPATAPGVERGGQQGRSGTRQPTAKPAPSGRPGTTPAPANERRRFGSNRGYDRGGHYYGSYGRYSHGWGRHSWSWTWYLLFGLEFGPPPFYWDPFYWGSPYYRSHWWPWFGGWTIIYVPYPYDPYYPAGVIGYCGQTGVKFDTAAFTNSTDKKIVRESEVYADGTYAGIVKDFDGWRKDALRLNQGNHTIEVLLPNGESFTRTVTVRLCEIAVIHIPQLPHPAVSVSAPPANVEGEQSVAAPGTTPGAPAAQDEDELLRKIVDRMREQDRLIEELRQKVQQLEKH